LFLAFVGWFATWIPGSLPYSHWAIQQTSSIQVSGTSNVKDFTCRMESGTINDTLSFLIAPQSQVVIFRQQELLIPLQQFNCGNRIIQHDFLTTLQEELYPDIKLQFIDLRLADSPTWWREPVDGAIAITIGGVTQRYVLRYTIAIYSDNLIELNGEQLLSLSAFNLETPKRLAGLVKIDNHVTVQFRLLLKGIA
jgi:hypothetical protein